MNKNIAYFLLGVLLIFTSVTSVFALPMPPIFVGGGGNVHVNDDYVTHPEYLDNLDNVNAILTKYNELYNPDLPSPIALSNNVEAGDYGGSIINRVYKDGETSEDEIIAGRLIFTPGTEYVSLKWDAANGGFGLWYVSGISYLDFPTLTIFDELSHGLSHYREWNANPVPEPATMLLLGAGLICLGGFGRKKLKK